MRCCRTPPYSYGRVVRDGVAAAESSRRDNQEAKDSMSEYDFPVGYRPYPRYRDFGISQVQAMPSHWHSKRVKHLGELRGGAGFRINTKASRLREYHWV